MTGLSGGALGICAPSYINYETKTFEELKEFRKRINLSNVRMNNGDTEVMAYLIRMIDILIEKVDVKNV